MCEVRDYEREKALRSGQDIRIQIGDEHMILSPTVLRNAKVINSQASKLFPGTKYLVYGFEWNPIKDENI